MVATVIVSVVEEHHVVAVAPAVVVVKEAVNCLITGKVILEEEVDVAVVEATRQVLPLPQLHHLLVL